jgi:hypothetical protein
MSVTEASAPATIAIVVTWRLLVCPGASSSTPVLTSFSSFSEDEGAVDGLLAEDSLKLGMPLGAKLALGISLGNMLGTSEVDGISLGEMLLVGASDGVEDGVLLGKLGRELGAAEGW